MDKIPWKTLISVTTSIIILLKIFEQCIIQICNCKEHAKWQVPHTEQDQIAFMDVWNVIVISTCILCLFYHLIDRPRSDYWLSFDTTLSRMYQLMHWRKEHNVKSDKLSPSANAAVRPRPQMNFPLGLNSQPHGNDTKKCAIKEGTSNEQSGTQTACHDKPTPDLLVKEGEVEIPAEPEEPASRNKMLRHNCATCSIPTKTRCARCKSVYYCSGMCQIIHWRLGHKETCEPFSKPTAVAALSEIESPMQLHSPVNFNLMPCRIDTNKCGIQERTSHVQFGILTKDRFINNLKKGAVDKLEETKLKGECSANWNSSSFKNSLESDSTATVKENLQNLDGAVSKSIQQNRDESTLVSGKRHKQTISQVKMIPSNPDANTPTDFEAHMLNRDGSKTKQVNVLEERNDKIIMQRIGNKFSQEIIRLKEELEKERNKLQKLEKIQEEVLKENQELKTKQQDMAKDRKKKRNKLEKLEKIQEEALKENQELKTKQQDMAKELEHLRQHKEQKVSKDSDSTNCMEFSYLELREATSNFDEKLKIGEGGYGSVYRGVLHCTSVAIKVLHSGGNQGEREFYKEVEVLRKVRHPNIVALIGGCSQMKALVYEFIPNGSLDNYLSNSTHKKLLNWKAQIEIASNISSALVFLHSTKPHGIAHGDLKPANILLDSKYQGKLSDFGISRQLVKTGDTITPHHLTEQPRGTLAYIDPEYLQTGEMNPQCDVYSFGIILLQLVTGKPATGICKSVQEALKIQGLYKEIDVAAKWPTEKAIKMVKLGLRCCNSTRKNRPNSIDVWNEIESLKQDASR